MNKIEGRSVKKSKLHITKYTPLKYCKFQPHRLLLLFPIRFSNYNSKADLPVSRWEKAELKFWTAEDPLRKLFKCVFLHKVNPSVVKYRGSTTDVTVGQISNGIKPNIIKISIYSFSLEVQL